MGRKKENKTVMPNYRIEPETLESLKQTAIDSGFTYGDGAAMGEFFDRLAKIDRELLKIIIKKT